MVGEHCEKLEGRYCALAHEPIVDNSLEGVKYYFDGFKAFISETSGIIVLTVKWQAFVHDGTTYDLTHLHPCTLQFERPAEDKKTATTFTVDVTFGLHCFSVDPPKDLIYDPRLRYADARHIRVFDFGRYGLSTKLPKIIEELAGRQCHNSGKGNFFTIEVVDKDDKPADYDIFFLVTKSSQKGRINLFIQSAYIRERKTLTSSTPIKFLYILHNVLNKIPIKP